MRYRHCALVITLVIVSLVAVNRTIAADVYLTDERQDQNNKQLLAELIALNREFVDAAIRGDRAKLEALTSEDYSAFEPYFPYLVSGSDRLSEIHEAWADYAKTPAGNILISRREAQPRVQVLGRNRDMAILTYVEFESVKTPSDRVIGGRAGKATFIYHRVGNGWILVHSHIAPQAGHDYDQIVR
jgi:ketosteroid isomerase-like protein